MLIAIRIVEFRPGIEPTPTIPRQREICWFACACGSCLLRFRYALCSF